MKRIYTTALLFSLAAAAHAQSSPGSGVTLYGVVMSGLIYSNNSLKGASIGTANGPSRWGFKGVEDLGGGTSTVFVLEGGFNPNTGTAAQGSREFGRQAYVGLANGRYGTLTLGRQYDLTQDWLAQYSSPLMWNGYTATIGDNNNFNYQFRTNNSVKYVSPSYRGLQAGLMYSFGGVAGSFGNQSAVGFGVNYAQGPLKLSAAYMRMNHPASAASEGLWTTASFASISPSSPTVSYAIAPSSMEIYGAGGQYAFTKDTFAGIVVTHSRYDDLGVAQLGLMHGRASYTNVEANVSHYFAPDYQAAIDYTYTIGSIQPTDFKPQYHQISLINNYFLSRRTALYLDGIFQLAAGDAQHANIEYASGSGGASATKRQVSITAGIYHRF
ncbi:gram-negative porin family protein [Paraburkholderia xenovorans LB400]|uniref:Outer membrane porin, OmpC family n=1 Tax=Paraburkholderia xenovorans (strain LB400) TaxID=266265 RepID=Q13G08_PARXL|nr:porin [Paraburkholderia xenovorans]ABE36981.1 outer membrane porin, OmpC family [Paraburkholderia xenovorans LB400]AIP34861.1 gram-negative porin family protein [Paraburkholderia xenovorans LB400]